MQESNLEKDFHYYLADSEKQQPFNFYKLDDSGEITETV